MGILYGAAYYPELWPEERWAVDAKLMADAGYNVVRIGEFAWSSMERSEGCFNWGWLDRVIDVLYEHGISTILCTPTATPPPWVVDLCPGMLPLDVNRSVRPQGGRRHYCYNNPDYRRHSARIAGALAERYGRHPAIVGWQIDNEFAQENTGRCHCPVCAEQFQNWLRARYGTLDALNAAWGTAHWSMEFNRWGQIEPPTQGVSPKCPSLMPAFKQNSGYLLDFERFSSDSIVDYQRIQVEAIRPHTASPITHNTTGIGTDEVDIYNLAKDLDCNGLDCYPDPLSEDLTWSSFSYSHARGVMRKPFRLLETTCSGGQNVWSGQATAHPSPGRIRLVNWQALAHGAESLLHFQWRPFPKGAEQLQHGVIGIGGQVGRVYHEVKEIGAEVRRLSDVLTKTTVRNEVAMLFSYDHLWSTLIKSVDTRFGYTTAAMGLYREITAQGIGVDVLPYDADLSQYRAVVLPMPTLMRPDIADKLKQYVADGGTLVTTFLMAVKDWDNGAFTERPTPGLLDDLLGAIVAETDVPDSRIPASVVIEMDALQAESSPGVWIDILEPRGAEVIGTLTGSHLNGEAVVTRNRFGKGSAFYIGTWLESDPLRRLLGLVLDDAGVTRPPFQLPDGVEFVRREGDGMEILFILNWTMKPARITLDTRYHDLLRDAVYEGELAIPASGLLALVREMG